MSCQQYLVLQNAVNGTATGEVLNLIAVNQEPKCADISISGITTATVTFQASLDGANWFPVSLNNLASTDSTSRVATATADGVFRLFVGGLRHFRANITSHTTGVITVIASVT